MEYDENGNPIPDSEQFSPSVNTYVIPDESGEFYRVNNFQRLADKLFGAVEMNLDNAVFNARMKNAQNEQAYKQVLGQSPALLPAPLQAWITRNTTLFFPLIVMGIILFFGVSFLRAK